MSDEKNKGKKIAIVGGGLVGCLAACYFADRHFDVTLYEYRGDIRTMKQVAGRSINMAMSERGRKALRGIGAEETIISKGIEMHSRMLHDMEGKMTPVPYGKSKEESIFSIDRRRLNEILLTEAEKHSNVKIVFNHKLTKCNTDTGHLDFFDTESKQRVEVNADLIVGCDGSFSVVRTCLLKSAPIDFAQQYISSWYIELNIPPSTESGLFALPNNHLHIWPRRDFMLIALPNQDGSFTCTLFMPLEKFDQILNEKDVITFFETYFVDALELIGRDALIDLYFSAKPSPLLTVRVSQHHGKKCVLFGDSAHAMVPFYGQGMNAGFEDCSVFFDLFDHNDGFANIVEIMFRYSQVRVPDTYAICDLALANYDEMKYLVTTWGYKLRKKLDAKLNAILPGHWIPLYSMVSFSTLRYSDIVKMKKTQDKAIKIGGLVLASAALLLAGSLYAYLGRNSYSYSYSRY